MTRPMTEDEVRLSRVRAQRLTGDRSGEVADAVRHLVGIQSQDVRPARLALRPRTTGTDAAAVARACNEDRTVVRTWAMRGTLHMVAADDLGWIVGLLGPVFAAADSRRRRQLGLDDALLDEAVPALCDIIAADGPSTRADLVRRLDGTGIALDPRSQAPAHLMGYAAMTGLVCRGADGEKDEPTYALVEDWVGTRKELDADESLAELTRRYVASRGPVAPPDLAKWSGLPARQARKGFELVAGELTEVDAAGEPAWVVSGTATQGPGTTPSVRLVGHFDEYLLGYRNRDLVVDPAFARRIQAGGFVQPALLVDGRVAGTWRQQRTQQRLVVDVQPFAALPEGTGQGVASEVADVGRFLGLDAELRMSEPG